MKRSGASSSIVVRGLAALIVMASLAAAVSVRAKEAQTQVMVFAAASLSDAFTELGGMFEREHPGTAMRFNFAGSQQLAAQLEQGAHADCFASADDRWMKWLTDRKLIDGEPSVFAHNHLVAIVPKSNPGRVGKLQDLARRGVKLVVGSAAVPVGAYTREMLKRLSAMPGFDADYAARVSANIVSEEENVKGVLFKVQIAEADAGVVYGSDVSPSAARYVRVFEIPDAANPLASYPIAVVHGAAHADLARAFIALLGTDAGRQVLARHHLIPVTP